MPSEAISSGILFLTLISVIGYFAIGTIKNRKPITKKEMEQALQINRPTQKKRRGLFR